MKQKTRLWHEMTYVFYNFAAESKRIMESGSKKQGNQELIEEKDLSFWVLGNKWRREALGVTKNLNVILD